MLTASPYEVLDVPAFATESEVKKTYRKKSLLIHPDKFKHEQGPEVSGAGLCRPELTTGIRLAEEGEQPAVLVDATANVQAEGQLSDKGEREKIDSIMTYARTLVLKA